jgi:hypothetical protein
MTPATKIEPKPRLTARAKVHFKAQLTLSGEIGGALHNDEGDQVEFAVHDLSDDLSELRSTDTCTRPAPVPTRR